MSDNELMNLLTAINTGALSQESFNSIAGKYKNNPPAIELINNTIKKTELMPVAEDNRIYQTQLFDKFIGNLQGLNRTALKDGAGLTIDGLLDFVSNRLADDMTIKNYEQ